METRKGSPTLLVVLVIASLLLTTVYFREGDRGPIHGARSLVLAATAPVSAFGTWASTPFRAAGAAVGGLGVSRTEVEQLRTQNAQLRERLKDYEEARQENERLRALFKFVETAKLSSVGARVIGRSANSWERVVVIDRGTADGVKAGLPVLSEEGVIGQVIVASTHAAEVRLVTHQDSRIAAMVQSSRAAGIVRGTVDGGLTLDFIDRARMPRKGDVVITSGMGGVYPKGLVVGDVVSVEAAPSQLYPKVVVRSRLDVGDIEELLVLTGAPPKTDLGGGE